MLFNPIMRLVILDGPVRIKIAGKLFRVADLINLAARAFRCFFQFFQPVFCQGPTGLFDQSSIHGHPSIYGKAIGMELLEKHGIDMAHGLFGKAFSET